MATAYAFKAHDTISTDTIDEGKYAGQDLDLQSGDQERAILNVDTKETRVQVQRGKCLYHRD